LEKKDRGEKRKNIPHQKKQGQHEERGNHRDIIVNRGSYSVCQGSWPLRSEKRLTAYGDSKQ
jgi:hypothetical protein